MKHAVIDIGSNSVRLLMESDGKILYKTLETTRLADGLANTGTISAAAMYRTALAVREFKFEALRGGASEVYAFATAAVRSAANGEDFVRLTKEIAGIDVDVISGEEEARIGLTGVLGSADGGVLDVGGGSTELIVRKGGDIVFAKSLDIGAVRLYDLCGRDREKLQALVRERLTPFAGADCDVPLYAIGGTATSLAALSMRLARYDAEKVQDYVLSRERLDEVIDEIFSLTPETLTAGSCLPLKRSEVVGGGAVIVAETLRILGVGAVTVSERDNLEGYLAEKL